MTRITHELKKLYAYISFSIGLPSYYLQFTEAWNHIKININKQTVPLGNLIK